MWKDTIAAISTPMGEGGIAVIRVSGEDAVRIAESIVRTKIKLSQAESHTVHYGHVIVPETGERVDEVLATVMRAPRSFTMEDVVEISCHGGLVAVRRVMDLLLAAGARLAEPGEFTKRAFLNGRIDLTQAEAVMDLIRSKSDRAFRVAKRQAEGALSAKVRALRQRLVELVAHIEVNVDYPEHDVEELTHAHIRQECEKLKAELEGLLHTARQGKLMREGIVTAIIGRPNVGKSSLLNALSQTNRAIVTDIPGTTRDVIEEYVTVRGIPLKLLDTAGIRETSDVVERMGVERSRHALEEADLVLFVLNAAEELHVEELEMLDRLAERSAIVIMNKTDLPVGMDMGEVENRFPAGRIVPMSVLADEGMDRLEKAIADLFFSGSLESDDWTYVSNVRHIHLLERAKASLEEAIQASLMFTPIDLVQIDVRNAWEELGEVIGDAIGESLIDQIFSQFCLGK